MVEAGMTSSCGSMLERLSLKAQIVIAYSVMAAVVCVISIVLSSGMFENLSSSVYHDSRRIIISQSVNIARGLADDVGNAVSQMATSVGNSVCRVSARYAKTLLTTTDPVRSAGSNLTPLSTSDPVRLTPEIPPFKLLKAFPTFAEFNFTSGCVETGGCPSDYGPLSTRSRHARGEENGSLLHTSTYLYSSTLQHSVRTTDEWLTEFGSSQALSDVRDALAVQDEDQKVMYSNNGSFIAHFYLATKITSTTGEYHAILRTYPGLIRNSSAYDPTTIPWFNAADAMENVVNFYGPFVEPFAHRRVVTLSSKQSFPYLNHSVEVVAAAVVDVENVRQLVSSFSFTNGGYAVIFNKQTKQVLTWGSRTDLVDEATNTFRTVHDMDPLLPTNLCEVATFEYVDATGMEWLAGCADSSLSSVSLSSTNRVIGPALTSIVFAQKLLAVEPLNALRLNMDNSGSSINATVLAVVCGLSLVVMLLVLVVVWNITSPLETMRRVALQVIEVMAEDQEARDFAPVLNKAGFNVTRTDEVGVLACDFYQVMCLMHNKVVERRATPKYPPNPWFLHCDKGVRNAAKLSFLTWHDLRTVEASRLKPHEQSLVPIVGAQSTLGDKVAEGSPADSADRPVAVSVLRRSMQALNRMPLRLRNTSKVAPLENGQLATIMPSKPVGRLTCLKTQLSTLAALLVLGVVGVLLVTVYTVEHDGGDWSTASATAVTNRQVQNLRSIAALKATVVKSQFSQMALDARTAAAAYTSILMGDFTDPTWEAEGKYLHSYSADVANPYSINPHGPPYLFSSYWLSADANCSDVSPPTCDVSRNSTLARLTSLADIKIESLLYPGTYISFTLAVHDSNGFSRFWPMWYVPTFAVPTVCWPNTEDIPFCADMIKNSKCGNASLPTFPVLDTRCRSWYAVARQFPATDVPNFMTPRMPGDGSYVLTAVLNIANRTSGARMGALNMNFFMSSLIASINSRPIMTHGYNYIVNVEDIDSVIIHPRQTLTCGTVRCVEDMTAEEYAVLKSTVLLAGNNAETTYVKGGQTWRVATHPVQYGLVNYLLVATVPDWEVVEFATQADGTIDQSTRTMAVAFGVTIAAAVTCMVFIIASLVRMILKPLDDLRLVMHLALRKDFTRALPKQAGSSDMAALMTAITQLLVALRLDNCSGESPDIARTHAVFVDSVNLFRATGNRKGLGASLRNLAALELAMGNSSAAKGHYERSVELAQELASQLEAVSAARHGDVEAAHLAEELRRARCMVSDRQGALAVALLEAQDISAAVVLLDKALADDKRNLHIRGYVTKQSMLGKAYLRQKKLADAERVFTTSLSLLHEIRASAIRASAEMNVLAVVEANACEMIALCDMAALAEASYWRTSVESIQALERKYLQALMTPAHMDADAARRLLRSLSALYGRHPQFTDAQGLVQSVAVAHELSLKPSAREGVPVARRVMLVLGYSESMAGSRLRSVKDALHAFVKEHLRDHDSAGIVTFSDSAEEVLPLTAKVGHAMRMAKCVEGLVSPTGGAALYDGVLCALKALQLGRSTSDWVVILADGADDKSTSGLQEVLRQVSAAGASVVALGIGANAPKDVLQQIAQASKRGFCVCMPATRADISDLFDEVARLLQPLQVMLEDY